MEAWDKQYPIDEKEKRIRELL
ncbi:TPA: endonuclease, partial [Campylobacter jejuni]